MNKTAIVIGATGLIGRALVNKLVESDHINKIITLTRSVADHPSEKVDNHIVDFNHLEDASEWLKGDFFFSALGTTLKQAGSVDALRKVDLDYQLTAAQIAAKNGVEHYLLVSSSGANAQSKSTYLKIKGELEEQVKILPFKRISIFQPSLLLGQRQDFRLAEKVGGMLLSVLNIIPVLRRYRPITGKQVATKMTRVSLQPGPSFEQFNLDEIFD